MTPDDYEFIIANTIDSGTNIIRACIRTGNDRWKGFFEAGYPERTFDDISTRRDFASALRRAKDPALLETIVRAYVGRLPPKKRVKLFTVQLPGSTLTLWQDAMEDASHNPAQRRLVELAKEYGAALDAPIKFKLRTGGRGETTGLASAIINREPENMRTWLSFGAQYATDPEAQKQMADQFRFQNPALVPMLKILIEEFNTPLELLMPLTTQDQTSKDGCAYLHAKAARQAMDRALATQPAPV